MITKKLEEAINKQINEEMFSSYLYLSMASWFESQNLKGFGNWMRIQAMEELTHAKRFYAYLIDRGARVILKEIRGPKTDWKNPIDAFEDVLKHEQVVTGLINNLADLALEAKDHATHNFLQFFIAEQVEEEANADAIIQSLKLVNDQQSGLFLIDKDLAARAFIPPVGVTI